MSPLIAFLIIFVLLLIALIKFKVTPSVGLFAAAVIFGLMVGMPAADVLSTLPAGFGNMMTSIGLLIVFGSIFGDFLGESGATEELAKGMVRLFGKKNDLLALNLVGFILSIPIYFGCAYVMTAPLVVALQKISRKNMKAYVIAIFTGLMLTHSCVAPTPGPLAVAGQAGANIGWFIIWGLVVCLPASLLIGWVYANFVASAEEKKAMHDGMKAIMDDDKLLAPDPTKPSAMKSFLLVILPIVMIVFASIFSLFVTEGPVYTVVNFFGNSNIALFIAMLVTGYTLRKYIPNKTVMGFIDESANRVGNILLIVGAGGCFASMLGATTMSTDLVEIMSATNMPVILLGFLLAFCIRAAVGSATAAMLTSIAIAGPVCLAAGISPIVAGLSVCLGAHSATFPTDVTFWFPSTYNGLNTKDCLMTTTVPCILSGIVGMVILAVLNAFSGVLPGMF
ncbi:GntP family permease [Angelakisella massiliensis]|uniref:GntP family permease n=1 Tax=Angelakisella massiliensis TaxID=1871018 RepID=UPI0008F82FD1|nr:SLC13 family permease [Angelakisella massiliensis]